MFELGTGHRLILTIQDFGAAKIYCKQAVFPSKKSANAASIILTFILTLTF